VLSVTQINSQIKALLESHFISLAVEGEISNFTAHTSGHLYFSLKDENSSIKCVMFKGNVSRLKFRPQNGMKILASCGISVYTPRGEYQLMCESLEPAGIGSLKVAFEQLKQKLEAKGYFKANLKRAIPKYPKKIALITSSTGAALQDMKKVAENRWKLSCFTLFNTLVQGEGAKEQIVTNISVADSLGFDVIVLARGGGSIEDLWAFNEEIVADAIYKAKTPIVSAIGHEIDYMISDFVADMRAPTPSAAMEMILPDGRELEMFLDEMRQNMQIKMQNIITKASTVFNHLNEVLNAKSPQNQINYKIQEAKALHLLLVQTFEYGLRNHQNNLAKSRQDIAFELKNIFVKKTNEFLNIENRINSLDPNKVSNDSYPLLVKDGKRASIKTLKIGDDVELQNPSVVVKATVSAISEMS
jgi:exodeoxyribonuclease VII large subunit